MIKIVAKYAAGMAILVAWLHAAHWAASSSSGAVNVIAGIVAISVAFTALITTFTLFDAPGNSVHRDDRFDAGMWSIAFFTNFVFWSRVAYTSAWDWFTGPGVLAFVLGVVSGVYAIWPEVEKDIASLKNAHSGSVLNFRRRKP